MQFLRATGGLAAMALACAATSASAATFLFDFRGLDAAQSATFTIKDELVPSSTTGTSVTFNAVSVTRASGTTTQTVNFYTKAGLGGFNFNNPGLTGFDAFGAQLFSGSTKNPQFLTGVYSMNRFSFGIPVGTLTISQVLTPVASPVPEPATWAFILMGFAGIGGMLRRRKRATARVRMHAHGAAPLA